MIGKFEEQCLLALIRCGHDSTAADVYEVLADRTGKEIKFGAVYTTLDRMVTKGWVTVEKKPDQLGGRNRRHFSISGVGQNILSESMASDVRLRDGLSFPDMTAGNSNV